MESPGCRQTRRHEERRAEGVYLVVENRDGAASCCPARHLPPGDVMWGCQAHPPPGPQLAATFRQSVPLRPQPSAPSKLGPSFPPNPEARRLLLCFLNCSWETEPHLWFPGKADSHGHSRPVLHEAVPSRVSGHAGAPRSRSGGFPPPEARRQATFSYSSIRCRVQRVTGIESPPRGNHFPSRPGSSK